MVPDLEPKALKIDNTMFPERIDEESKEESDAEPVLNKADAIAQVFDQF